MENRNCKNCKYYLAHYVKSTRGFRLINAGHCINMEVNKRRLKACGRQKESCEYWEPAELKIVEQKEKIKSNLERIEEYLHNVLIVLKDDDCSDVSQNCSKDVSNTVVPNDDETV